MNLSIYSDKSFVITGNTKEHKDTLKDLGGKWNSKLTCGSGWIFSLTKKKEVEEWLQKNQQNTSSSSPAAASVVVTKQTSFSLETLLDDFVLYLTPHYNNKNNKLFDILCEFYLMKKTTSENDELENYFINDNIKLYQHLFLFLKTKQSSLSHTFYQQLDKNKLIEHALIRLL